MRLVYLKSILWQTSLRTRKCTIYDQVYAILVVSLRYSSSTKVYWCISCGGITNIDRRRNDNVFSTNIRQNCRCDGVEFLYYNEYCRHGSRWMCCGRQITTCYSSYLYKLSYYVYGCERKSFRFNNIDNELKNLNMYGGSSNVIH